ncbi:hypothetical protein L2Y96_02485 [Luteibacter aegosomaticola]|uniref:hypothetical protein n=1 Tax=Luteibacter aegosomaticola TaxID=2911538 RepID=UPI001FF7B78D|nr:hypothetical protein [Luteibacter aegosomaticola]UPG90660.1 hypothetical protein L2Y96_02485 [Luteibacter aegosomaticola]
MTVTLQRKAVLLAGLLAGFTSHAQAAIEAVPGAGNHPGTLLDDAIAFTDAMINYTIDHVAAESRASLAGSLRREAKIATIARLEYTWEANGHTNTVVIHSRSGKPISSMLGPRDGSSSGGGSFEWSDAQVQEELAEVSYYPQMQGHFRATAARHPHTVLEATDAKSRGDAELKALQKLEIEFAEGRIPQGGRLLGMVSKGVCPSCDANFDIFSRTYDVDGKVYYLANRNECAAAVDEGLASEELASESIRGNGGFYASRGSYVERSMHGTVNEWQRMDRGTWNRGIDLGRLTEAESGSILAEGCP